MYRQLIRHTVATLIAIGGISFELATPNFADAQQCAARCPRRAQTERIVRDLIRETILDELDRDRSHTPSVSVRMEVLSVDPFGEVTEPLRGFLSPVEAGRGGYSALGVDGDISLSYAVECEYQYLVTITTRESDFDHHHHKQRRHHKHNHSKSVTESIITLRTPISSNARCGW